MRLNNFVYNVFLQKLDFFTKIKYIAYELVERPRFNLIRRADCPAFYIEFTVTSQAKNVPLFVPVNVPINIPIKTCDFQFQSPIFRHKSTRSSNT